MGNEAWTEVLEWPGSKSFQTASKKKFKVKSSGKTGGVYKSAEGFTFMRVSPSSTKLTIGLRGRSHVPHPPSHVWEMN
jgi:hypothetical protein